MCKFRAIIRIVSALICVAAIAAPPPEPQTPKDLADASLEELMSIQVTSVSKKGERLSQAAAAIYVITKEDIRRSAATTIPGLLRMAPGLNVARINTNSWAVSARGFNDKFANKLLVLVDGRNVYSELFSGTFWDVRDVPLEDIERIEVIRGPGATMWGANAVNGVINIITKSAKDTQGALVSAGGGSSERGFGEFRYGGRFGSDGYYRAYAQSFDRGPLSSATHHRTEGDWTGVNGGFRADWNPSARDSLILEGDIYNSGLQRTISVWSLTAPFNGTETGRVDANGGSMLARWQHHLAGGSDMALQVSYEHSYRNELYAAPDLNIMDLDFQHRMALSDRNSFLWGLGYRFTDLGFESMTATQPFPAGGRRDNLFQAFLQDEHQLAPDRLTLTIGTKFEHNPFSGFEVQPSVRLAWTPNSRETIWAAASRAVRTPSVTDTDLNNIEGVYPGPNGLLVEAIAQGNLKFHSEGLVAYESGYRTELSHRVSVDLAAFYNVYSDLRSPQPGTPQLVSTPFPHLLVPAVFGNGLNARSYGVEVATNLKLASWWRLSPSYSWLKMAASIDPGSADTGSGTSLVHGNPQHQFQVRSYLDLPWRLQFDTSVYSVSSATALQIPAYVRTDARLGWRASRSLEFSIAGENLLDGSHLEFFAPNELDMLPLEVGRSVYGKITWRFSGQR